MFKSFKIAQWLLLGSLATLAFKKPSLFLVFNLNDLLLILSLLFISITIIKKQISVTISKKIIVGFLIGIGSIILGTIITAVFFHKFAPIAILEYARMIAGMAICFEIYIIGSYDHLFIKKALVAIIFPVLLLPLAIYAPHNILGFFLDESATRFSGLLVDPNYFASFQILPTFIMLYMVFLNRPIKQLWISVGAFLLFIISTGSIIWSGSRGGIFGLGIAIIGIMSFMIWKLPWKKSFLNILLILLCVVSLLFVFLPHQAKQGIQSRSTGIINTHIQNPILRLTAQQNRFSIWQSSGQAILKNPFGYGPGYHQVAGIQGDANDTDRVAHDTPMQIVLIGGFLLLTIVIIGLCTLGSQILQSSLPLSEIHYLAAALIGILGAGLFLDSLFSRWVWVTIGLLLALIQKHTNKRATP